MVRIIVQPFGLDKSAAVWGPTEFSWMDSLVWFDLILSHSRALECGALHLLDGRLFWQKQIEVFPPSNWN